MTPDCPFAIDSEVKAMLLREMETEFAVTFSKQLDAVDTIGALVSAVAWELAQGRAAGCGVSTLP